MYHLCHTIDTCTTYVALVPIVSRGLLDAIGNQAHGGRRPQEEGKPSNQVFEELDELRELPWGGDGVGTISKPSGLDLILRETLCGKNKSGCDHSGVAKIGCGQL